LKPGQDGGWVEDSVDVDKAWMVGEDFRPKLGGYVEKLPPAMWRLREASLSKTAPVYDSSAFNHSREWAGYLSCLTAFHMLPLSLHPELCREILALNRVSEEFKHKRIEVPELVYWLLG